MKKIIYNTFALVLATATLSSCLKDDSMVLDPDKAAGNVIEFGSTGSPTSPAGAPIFAYTPLTLDPAVAEGTFTTSVRYAGAEDVAPQDITVEIVASPEAITTWNGNATAANQYNMLPAGSYTFPSSVTIKKGEKFANVPVTVKTGMLDATKSNALGLKIASTSHSTISGNFGTVIYNLPLKSVWEGVYTVRYQNNFGGRDANIADHVKAGERLRTVGPNRLQLTNIANTYGGSVTYQFNGNNTAITQVTVISGSTNFATSIQGIDHMDPVKGEFTIRYTWGGRGMTETWKKTGP